MNEGDVRNLTPDAVDELELGFGTSVCLTLVVCLLRYLLFQNLWWLRLLQDLVLTKGEETLEEVLRNRKADDQLLPREERPVQEPGQALGNSALACYKCSCKLQGPRGVLPVRNPSQSTLRRCRKGWKNGKELESRPHPRKHEAAGCLCVRERGRRSDAGLRQNRRTDCLPRPIARTSCSSGHPLTECSQA